MNASVPPAPLLSVIVPVYNGAATLGACLDALLAQTEGRNDVEIIVVDDGSTDGSARIAEQRGVSVLRQERAGAGAARNRGAQQARGNILLFTDADCEPLPAWIEQMVAPFSDPEIVGVKGAYRTRQRSPVARFAQAEYEEKYDRLARRAAIDFVDTYAAAYRRTLFERQGGFDPAFLLDEDQELSFRLAEAGHRMVFAPTAAVYHRHPTTVGRYAWRKVKLGRWKVRVLARHPKRAVHDSYTPGTQKLQLLLLPLLLSGIACAASELVPWAVPVSLSLFGLLTMVPLLAKARQQGWLIVLLAPPLVALRALALDVGLAWGTINLIVEHVRSLSAIHNLKGEGK